MPETAGQRHDNNFDFIRLAAALAVLLSHQYALTGWQEPSPVSFRSAGGLGVLAFFTISGFLVTMSWNRDPHPARFALRRILRIWPGWIAVTVATVFLLGPIVTTLSLHDYFTSPETAKYFSQLVLDHQYRLPGVFADNPHPNSVNGSLWTLPIEVQMYAILLVAGLATALRWKWLVLVVVLGFAAYVFLVVDVQHNHKWTTEFGLFFFAGVCCCLFYDQWKNRVRMLLAILIVVAAGLWMAGYQYASFFVVAPLALIAFGQASWPVVRSIGRFGDLSYGTYIYAFPVQQTVVWATGNTLSLFAGGLLSMAITLSLAFLSWHLVEKPALRQKEAWAALLRLKPRVKTLT